MANAVSVAPASNQIVTTLRTAYENFKAARARRAVYRTTLNELSALSNRDLADLGISRAGIRALAYEQAYS